MPFRPFQNEFADHRVVMIPATLDEQHRARFISKIAAAVKQQADLAAKCDSILMVSGEIQQRDDRIVIPHEPAAPGDPTVITAPPEPPDINLVWWLSWSLLRALKAATPGTPHGGIQIATFYLDEVGCLKLGDFGIAPVFEAICGSEARRQIHCDGTVREADGGQRLSGVWSLLSEDEVRDYGWITPYFAHELFEGAVRLNPKSDQFAAGTLLYLLATGVHPYGASLADPTLMLYFHLEPFPVHDERTDWAEILERQERGFSTTADRPVLAWSELVQKLLHSEAGERFANAAQAEAATAECCPAEWGDASAAISAALALLEAGEVDASLQKSAPWKDNEALPGLWREQLSRWVADVESRKEEIGAYKRLKQRLAEAHEALNNVEVERAREIAREVLAAPQCDDVLRTGAEELIGFCDEQEQFIQSGADDLAKAYLESAREYLVRNEFNDARQVLNGLLSDPAIPAARATQARRLIAEVELIEQRIEQQLAELNGAGDDLRAGRYEAAQQRLEALLAEESLPESTAMQARELLDDVTSAQARHAEYAAALDNARAAWERADLEALEGHLAAVPKEYAVPDIAHPRAGLVARCAPLRLAFERRAAAESALAADDVEAALTHAEQARDVGELPQTFRDQLDELIKSCQSTIAERQKERIDRARRSLRKARTACRALQIDKCRQTLSDDVIGQAGLPEDIIAKARELLQICERVEHAQTLFEHVRQHVGDGDFQNATALLDGLRTEGLPSEIVAQHDQLRLDVARAREEHAQREQQRLAARLDDVDAATNAGQLDDAQSALQAIEASPYLTDTLRQRAAAARSVIREQRRVLEAIEAAEGALSGEPSVLAKSLAMLDRLPVDLPDWATARIKAVRRRAAELAEQRRREAIQRGTEALNEARAALDAGDVTAGRSHLHEAREALELDPLLAERHEQLAALATQLEQWLPKVKAVAEKVERGDFRVAHRELTDLLAVEPIPELCRVQLADLKQRTEGHIAARQQQIDAELATLTTALAQRGRRARKFSQRVNALKRDSLATEQHHARADQLLDQLAQLPEPKTSKTPFVIAAGVGVIALICAGLYFGGVGGGGGQQSTVAHPAVSDTGTTVNPPASSQPKPPSEEASKPELPEQPPVAQQEVRQHIATALVRLQAELAEAAEQAQAQGRVHVEWALVFEPADELPTRLIAVEPSEGGRQVELGAAGSTAELNLLQITPELRDRLFPVPPPPPAPPIAARIAAAVKRLQTEVDSARAEQQQPEAAPRFAVRLDPPDSLPATVIAQNEQTKEEIQLGTVEEEGELDGLTLRESWREKLYPPPPPEPEKPTLADVWPAYLEELRSALADAVVNEQLSPAGEGLFEVRVQWHGRDLSPFSALRFDEGEARFSTPAAAVATHFRLQIEALDALGQPLALAIPPADPQEPTYQAMLRLAEPARGVSITRVDLPAQSVQVKTAVRLDGDPRPNVAFPFSAVYANGKFAIDDATRLAFNTYLHDLQKHRLEESMRGIEKELALPAGVLLRGPAEFGGGSRVPLRVQWADGRSFAAIDAVWSPQTLLYAVDADNVIAALRQAVRAAAQEQATRERLSAAWPQIRATLAPSADQPGAKYFGRYELLELTLHDEQPDEPFVVAVRVTIGPPDAAAEERIDFATLLTVRDGVLAWDADAARKAKPAIVNRLQVLAGDQRFRARRSQEALDGLATELHVSREGIKGLAGGEELRAEVVRAGTPRIFTWTWDNGELRYANRVESAPPPLSLDDKLARFASAPGVAVEAFASVLADVTRAKIERYGTSNYLPAKAFASAADAGEALSAVSLGLQKLIAPTPTRDPFPVVFIEYFLGETDVYALSWRAVTDDNDVIVGATDTKVWQVLPVASLWSYPEPAAFRQEYSSNAELGERLLGHAFADALEGSAKAGGGSFGVVVAPDGPLWLTRWEQVRFKPRPLANVDLRGAADPGRVATLRDLLKPTSLGPGRLAWRRAGLWCVPTLAGEWRGPADQIEEFQLGVLIPGQKPTVANFKWQRGPLVFASIADPTVRGADWLWPDFARNIAPEAIGYRFWDRGWPEGEGEWEPTPFTSFSLIQIP